MNFNLPLISQQTCSYLKMEKIEIVVDKKEIEKESF